MITVSQPITMMPPCMVASPMRAAGWKPIVTEVEPLGNRIRFANADQHVPNACSRQEADENRRLARRQNRPADMRHRTRIG